MNTETMTLEDGTTAQVGDRVFNYYDRFPVTIDRIGYDGWADTITDDGSRGPILNGQRMCSLEFAARRGWYQAAC